MPEHQQIEYKESWHDEYLKWICGYANANGGTLYIGIDDKGDICGIEDSKRLLEDLPNKITDTMGIIADVNLREKDGKEYIEIIVDKYPSLISLRGKYYYRSGSVLREITGKELERILLKSQGRSWDSVPIPKVQISDLDKTVLNLFRQKALARGRLSAEDLRIDDEELINKLHLIDDDGNLSRAAILAFYHDPEKWVIGSYIKIGCFENSDYDLRYQDEIHGSLVTQVDKAIDLVYSKYLRALIAYKDIQRMEIFMFPREAFREILLNAIVHKDYSTCNPIQISVYPDRIYVWNDGIMPTSLRTSEQLYSKHSSQPFNPQLAYVFFMSGMIEAWGRGFEKIKSVCKDTYNTPLPEYMITDTGIMVLCKPNSKYAEISNNKKESVNNGHNTDHNVLDRELTDTEKIIYTAVVDQLMKGEFVNNSSLRNTTGKSSATIKRVLSKMCDAGIIVKIGNGSKVSYVLSDQ